MFGADRESLRAVFLRNLRREVCGDDSFREKVESYSKSPDKAVLVTGLIVYVVNLVSLPINPAIATIVVLWVLKLGLRTFCEYTEPSSPNPLLPKGEGGPDSKSLSRGESDLG